MSHYTPTPADFDDDDTGSEETAGAPCSSAEQEPGEERRQYHITTIRYQQRQERDKRGRLSAAGQRIERYRTAGAEIVELYKALIADYQSHARQHLAGYTTPAGSAAAIGARDEKIVKLQRELDQIWHKATAEQRRTIGRRRAIIDHYRSRRASLYAAVQHLSIYAAATRRTAAAEAPAHPEEEPGAG